MNTEKLALVQKTFVNKNLAAFKVGDTVEVDMYIREGEKKRIQTFKGLVIAKSGDGTNATFTVRKISYGVGVEKIIPVHSPNVAEIRVIKHGSARRSKLYYLRDRVGKLALKVKPGKPAPVVENTLFDADDEPISAAETEENTDQAEEVTTDTVQADEAATEASAEETPADAETPEADTEESAETEVEEEKE